MHRRSFLMTTGKTAAITAAPPRWPPASPPPKPPPPGSRINHSVCKWCYGDIPLDDLCVAGKEMGLKSIELLMPADFPTLQKHGLTCAMVCFPTGSHPHRRAKSAASSKAFNRLEHHDTLVSIYEPHPQGRRRSGCQTSDLFLRQPRRHVR